MTADTSLYLVVADEQAVPDEALRRLAEEGWPLQRCTHGREALQLAVVGPIKLVLVDLDLPDMDGYELQAAYAEAHPYRDTPFVLLTDTGSPQEVIPALRESAISYLLRPLSADLLRRTMTRVAEGGGVNEARGELGSRSLAEVLDYCRAGGLTGELEVEGPELEAVLDFDQGRLVGEHQRLSEEDLQELAGLRVGTFTIRPRAVPAELPPPPEEISDSDWRQPEPLPPSRLTGVTVGEHLVDVRTQVDGAAGEQISTVVSVDGKERRRTTSIPPPRADRETLEQYMADQHAAVEAGVRGKVEALLVQKHKRPDPNDRELDRYVWLVRHSCAKGDYAGAWEILSGALAMFPHDARLHGYQQLARRKLAGG